MVAIGISAKIRGILLAALLVPSLAARAAKPAPKAQPDFCASLARVVAAARTEFETLHGKPRENGGWDATEVLPGLHDCEIQTNGSYYDAPLHSYQCVLSKRKEDAAASADQENLKRQVSGCLGESWKVGEIQHPESHSVFFEKKGEPSLQLTNMGFGILGREVGLSVSPPTVSVTFKKPTHKVIDLNALMDIKAKDETARTIFSAIARALDVTSVNDADAQGRATIERKDAPLHEVLDAVCAQAGLAWSLGPKDELPQLYLTRKKS